jgi:magnesium-transporting ATPase (P-type)
MKISNRFIVITGLVLTFLMIGLAVFGLNDFKVLFYLQAFITIAVSFQILLGKLLFSESVNTTKIRAIIVISTIFVIGIYQYFTSNIFQQIVMKNKSLFVVVGILISLVLYLVFKKKSS